MENNRLVNTFIAYIFLVGLCILTPVYTFAYEPESTHAALTQEIVQFFNTYYPNQKLTAEELNLVIQGSIDEDDGARALHHFYDPVYGRGLTMGAEWESSKDW